MDTHQQGMTVSGELDRLLHLHEGMTEMNRSWLELAPPDRLDWEISDDAIHRFGDGRTPVTIRNLFIHVAVAEHVWTSALAQASEGDQMPAPSDPALKDRLANGDLIVEAAILHEETVSVMRGLSQADLDKHVISARRRWTGMEFLWAIHAHRAFHLGHLDLYLRLNDRPTPEFFVYHPDVIDQA